MLLRTGNVSSVFEQGNMRKKGETIVTDKVIENNQVTVMGEIVSDFSFSHEIFGEGFYMMEVRVQRLSESYDVIPVMTSERLIDVTADFRGALVCVNGQFRSYNRHEERRNRLVLSVFAREIEFVDEVEESAKSNQIFLIGYAQSLINSGLNEVEKLFN